MDAQPISFSDADRWAGRPCRSIRITDAYLRAYLTPEVLLEELCTNRLHRYSEAETNHQMHPPIRYRAIIADDEAIFRYTLRAVVQECCEVIGEAENGLAAVEAAEALHPDLVFLDISMPVLDGFQAAAQIQRILPIVRMIFVSSHSDRAYIERAFDCGAGGYVLKGSALFQIPEAVEVVMKGRTFRAGY